MSGSDTIQLQANVDSVNIPQQSNMNPDTISLQSTKQSRTLPSELWLKIFHGLQSEHGSHVLLNPGLVSKQLANLAQSAISSHRYIWEWRDVIVHTQPAKELLQELSGAKSSKLQKCTWFITDNAMLKDLNTSYMKRTEAHSYILDATSFSNVFSRLYVQVNGSALGSDQVTQLTHIIKQMEPQELDLTVSGTLLPEACCMISHFGNLVSSAQTSKLLISAPDASTQMAQCNNSLVRDWAFTLTWGLIARASEPFKKMAHTSSVTQKLSSGNSQVTETMLIIGLPFGHSVVETTINGSFDNLKDEVDGLCQRLVKRPELHKNQLPKLIFFSTSESKEGGFEVDVFGSQEDDEEPTWTVTEVTGAMEQFTTM